MSDPMLLKAGLRLADHLRSLSVQNPVVVAGSASLFIYALTKDKARIGSLTEWEGIPVKVSFGGPFKPLGDAPLPAVPAEQAEGASR